MISIIIYKMEVDYQSDHSYCQVLRTKQKKSKLKDKEALNKNDNSKFIPKTKREKEKGRLEVIKQILMKNKLELLKKNFISKLRLNSIYRPVPQDDINNFEQDDENSFFSSFLKLLQKRQGFKLESFVFVLWNFFNVILGIISVFIFSVMMTFEETHNSITFQSIRIIVIFLQLVDLFLDLSVQRFEAGKQLKNLRQIFCSYAKNELFVDFVNIFSLLISFAHEKIVIVLAVVAFMKLGNSLLRFEKYEYIVLSSRKKEQYYRLIKLFIINCIIGHFLSIFLNLMASIDISTSWYTKINIQNSEWVIKYIWGYYWGTNIMLTVGFGDLAANNHYEAIVLIFIQTFSCITLAYNISEVGALISVMGENEVEKKKKLKFFHRMCQENCIPTQLQSKISNFIEKSYQIKQDFEYDEFDSVLESLPKNMQSEYRKESNKILFDGLGFLNNLSKKSMLKLAESVERKICHPEEIIQKKGTICEFYILQQGNIAFSCRNGSTSKLNGKKIEFIKISKKEKPKVLSLDFIKNKEINFDIRSVNYSIVYYLEMGKFIEALKGCEMDYELYCMLRDKNESILDENNLYLCSICKTSYHNKFQCSRLHYRPIKQATIANYLGRMKRSSNGRKQTQRERNCINVFVYRELVEHDQVRFKKEYLKEDINLKRHFSLNKPQRLSFVINKPQQKLLSDDILSKIQEIMALSIKNGEIDFWDLQSDQAHNYRYYFPKNNPSRFNEVKNRHQIVPKKILCFQY